ncbi:Hexapeptide repeat of succinyl-transferase [Hydrobacter penzbergensis]|uniref:Hexapeptide repeat of succinyl-transferase n=1 Tax=Hydrobacter penzbergensis TaxID=1235997 RepID=A0A8X8LBD1_9BACT|nr:acyltransferase [Hydrobacter penzbergensis]SDW86409.1 Hexapeptide repeat of succinyl-transferase [Hydrobacter penzbergensis]
MSITEKLIYEVRSWFELYFIRGLPNGFIGTRIRRIYWKWRVKQMGAKSIICRMAQIEVPVLVRIGDNFLLGDHAIVNPGESKGIFIGSNVSIASNAFLRAANHSFDRLDIPISMQGHNSASIEYDGKEYSIVIEDDVWIAYNAVIVSGAKIGKGSVIAAGSVVSSVIPPWSIVVGNPGRVIGNREKKNIVSKSNEIS